MKREESLIETEEAQLISGEPEQEEYAPVLRVLIAVGYMGVLAAVVAAMAAILSLVSGREAKQSLWLSIAAVLAFGVLTFVLSLVDRKKRREFALESKRLLKSAERFKGAVVSAEKHTKKVKYANESFEEISWNFVINYKDENGDAASVKSGRYLNDISNVLGKTDVTVIKKPGGAYAFEGFVLRESGEEGVKLEVAEIEDE